MIEIRLHGLGGQGAVTSAEILAIAAFKQGLETQAFPFFGVERTGSPVESYVRLDHKPIKIRQHIYKPDWLIVLAESVINKTDITQGLSPHSQILINSQKSTSDLAKQLKLQPKQIKAIDLSQIQFINTAILGAFAKISQLITLNNLQQAILEKLSDKEAEIIKTNVNQLTQIYEQS